MSATIRDILNTNEKQSLLVEVFEAYIKKCKSLANSPTRGFGSCIEKEKKKAWARKAEDVLELQSDIMNELI
jgi:hypothetical protein